ALHHSHQPVGALRCEVLPEMQQAERGRRVEADDSMSRLAGIKREEDGDQTAHNMCIAVADEAEARTSAVRLDLGRQPYLTHAALHLVGSRAVGLGQGLELAPEFD